MAVWQHNTLLVFAGNYAFKHSPALGEHLAQAATGQPLTEDLRPESRLGAPPDPQWQQLLKAIANAPVVGASRYA